MRSQLKLNVHEKILRFVDVKELHLQVIYSYVPSEMIPQRKSLEAFCELGAL